MTFHEKQIFHETDVTERESSAETDADELEEDDRQETEDLRSGVNIEHGQNEEQVASHIRSCQVSNVVTAIDNVRKIARIIRKSPVKMDTLQSYVKSKNRKSIHLLLDCNTIWNSLVAMLERYIDLRSPVEKNIDLTIFTLSEAEYVSLAAIVRAKKPIQLGSEKHCSRDVTHLSAEGVFFIIEEFHEQNSAFSMKLKEALISRQDERRQKTLIGLENTQIMGKSILQIADHQDTVTLI